MDQDQVRDRASPCSLLHQIIERQVALRPGENALWWQGEAITYASLAQQIDTVTGSLASRGTVGDRVAVLSWNRPEYIELIYGAAAAGRILVPLNARLAPAEIIFQLQASGARTLLASADLLAPLKAHADFPRGIEVIDLDTDYAEWKSRSTGADLPVIDASDPAWILYTSGSTGRPKGAVLSHDSFMAGLRSAALARPVEPTDRYYYPFPLFHISAHNVLLQHLNGAAVVLDRSFDAASTLKVCRELRVTTMSLAPTMIQMLLEHPDFEPQVLDTVRTIGYGASVMPQNLLQRLLTRTHVGLCQSYGMTELSGSIAFLTVADHRRAARQKPELLQSVGRPLPTAKVKLIDETGRDCQVGEQGEILVQAPQCMQCYWNDEDATAAALDNGWLRTGDIGRLDEEGYLYIVDRKKDMIISGGENIASREIEDVLRRHPSVGDCAVIGLSDPKWGERPCAILRLVADVSDQALQEHCGAFLAGFKVPRRWIRVESLPLNAAGKIDKPLLRRQWEDAD